MNQDVDTHMRILCSSFIIRIRFYIIAPPRQREGNFTCVLLFRMNGEIDSNQDTGLIFINISVDPPRLRERGFTLNLLLRENQFGTSNEADVRL